MRIGYFLSSEEFDPRELVKQARMAEDAGVEGLWISDPTRLAARIGDGYCTVTPDAEEVKRFRDAADASAIVAGAMKVCWGTDEREARATAYRLWPNEQLPGELAQILTSASLRPTPTRSCPASTTAGHRRSRPQRLERDENGD